MQLRKFNTGTIFLKEAITHGGNLANQQINQNKVSKKKESCYLKGFLVNNETTTEFFLSGLFCYAATPTLYKCMINTKWCVCACVE
jgi:hypothetical protein